MNCSSFNSVSLISKDFKFTAKYPAPTEKDPENPLKGVFNYIHLVPYLEQTTQNSPSQNDLIDQALKQFQEQELPQIKIKLLNFMGKTEKQDSPQGHTFKQSAILTGVNINHGSFREDQIAQGDGNSEENLRYSIRLHAEHLTPEDEQAIQHILDPHSAVSQKSAQAVRDAVAHGQALEVGLLNAENALLPALTTQLKDKPIDLKMKLKRNGLFENTTVVIGRSNFLSNKRNLWKTEDKTSSSYFDPSTPTSRP